MALSSAFSSFGTLLKMGDGAGPEVFSTIAEVNDISGPEFTADTEEVTNHSTVGGYKEYIATLKDGGTLSFDLNFFGDATQEALRTNFEARTRTNFTITYPSGDTIAFAGFITKLSAPTAPVQGVLRQSTEIMVTGAATWS